ncbi:hypothetical protein [Edaphobacter albus]|uniref:hypothetical protein n=1 Tax=Edaphobacter sp. 4G125 TaxID=2763071 RepID=UPI00164656E9|nr:hypothetical protein [Edaphobacter sp. 4G125]QNI35305.1 hypothetical protein H7846_09335 [Edaphobacter sp. 4G125]
MRSMCGVAGCHIERHLSPILRYDLLRVTDPVQPRILHIYTALAQIRSDWGGSFILSLGLDSWGAALSIAADIAGAVSLSVDNNPNHLREIVRSGAADFVVTTLDEAIRAMKNEVRKQAPLSVALNADPFAVLEESVARGLAPQLFSSSLPEDPRIMQSAQHFQALGAKLLHFREDQSAPSGFLHSETILDPFLRQNDWQSHTFRFDTPLALREFDTRALSLLPEEDALRYRWLTSVPRFLQRQRPPQRTLWLTEQEAKAL